MINMMMSSRSTALLALAAILHTTVGDVQAQDLAIELVTGDLDAPLFVTHAPNDESRIFILEKWGDVHVYDLEQEQLLEAPYLTLDVTVDHLERGLLGMAFDPAYDQNGFVYFNYTAGDKTVVERYTTSSENPNVADPDSAVLVICVDQPQPLHNAGWIDFGPDGYLYIALGDGGPPANAQDLNQLLGKMLRIDVSTLPYEIPLDNPYQDDPDRRGEIWASGLRNPFRCSFDRLTGDLWISDVGQNTYEEVSYQPAGSAGGANYGWPCFEGDVPNWECDDDPVVVDPLIVFEQITPPGAVRESCAVIGGYVYRGDAIPELHGRYVYSDHCSSRIWSVRLEDGEAVDLIDHSSELAPLPEQFIMSFGEDARGEIYACTRFTGRVYRINPELPPCSADVDGDGLISVTDLTLVVTSWGPCNGKCPADVDGDGTVDTADLVQVIINWGPCT